MEFTPDQAAVTQIQAEQLQSVLEKRIIGKRMGGWQCDCGTLHALEAQAVRVVYPDDLYSPYQKVLPRLWRVQMQELAQTETDYSYSIGISQFLPREEIRQLFAEHFGDLIAIAER
jgi:hypothetical protein